MHIGSTDNSDRDSIAISEIPAYCLLIHKEEPNLLAFRFRLREPNEVHIAARTCRKVARKEHVLHEPSVFLEISCLTKRAKHVRGNDQPRFFSNLPYGCFHRRFAALTLSARELELLSFRNAKELIPAHRNNRRGTKSDIPHHSLLIKEPQ